MIKINETNVTSRVNDFGASLRFYERIGFTLKKRGESDYTIVTASGATMGVHPTEPDQIFHTGDSVSITSMIDNADEAGELLKKNNIVFKEEDGNPGLHLHFKHPDCITNYFTVPRWSY